jgi:pilus assembly protein CpaB
VKIVRGKTILTILFVLSLVVAAIAAIQMSQKSGAATPKEQILAATVDLPAGTFLRAQDVTWQGVSETAPDEIARPNAAALEAKPDADEDAKASVYGAVLRHPLPAGEPIRRGAFVKPGERDFLQIVLTPGARAIAIPVATGGASTGLLSPGDHVDVILTQNFKNDNQNQELRDTPLTRKSVSETVVENLRVLAVDAPDLKNAPVNQNAGSFGRTVSMEVTADQAEQINVAAELGKLSLTLRSVNDPTHYAAASPGAEPIKAKWAGDVSPALSGAAQEKPVAVIKPNVTVIHGSKSTETIKPES